MTNKQYNNDSTKDKEAGSTINKYILPLDFAELKRPNQWTNNTIHVWKPICIKHLKITNNFISEIAWKQLNLNQIKWIMCQNFGHQKDCKYIQKQ